MVYQPHRYTRTRDLFVEFCDVLAKPDLLLLLDVYSAGEQYIAEADGAALSQAIKPAKNPLIFVKSHQALAGILQDVLQDGDILLMQGAGNIGALASHLAATKLQESVSEDQAAGAH